jgi:hypothetical protein
MTDNVVTLSQPTADPSPAASSAPEARYAASLYCGPEPLPRDFVRLVRALERELEMPIWLLIQQDEGDFGDINAAVHKAFDQAKNEIERNKPVGLLLHSPGGFAEEGYKIVRLFQRRTDNFKTIVPLYAKSAATMMALGGREIIMGHEAELGPLDVQMMDSEDDHYESALNAVQSLERLNSYALTALDQAMALFYMRTRKKPDALLPLALQYATSMIGPLVGKIDSVALTKKSRALKVAEDYALRLMKEAGYPLASAKRIASILVERYSTHGFVIDRTEAKASEREPFGLGLRIAEPKESVQILFDGLQTYLDSLTVIGKVVEIPP